MGKAQLVFVPTPGIGHLVASVELAKLLLTRDHRLSVTVLILNLPHMSKNYIESMQDPSFALSNRLRLVDLPKDDSEVGFHSLFEGQKSNVREAVLKITQSESSVDPPRLAGFVLDMFCTPIMDLANDFGVPSYVFFTSSAAFLGMTLHLQKIHDEENFNPDVDFKDSDTELSVPSLINPFPARIMPSPLLNKERFSLLMDFTRKFREAKGIIVNTFFELESHAIGSFETPPVYPVGPLLDVGSDGRNSHRDVMQWLDDQPESSVVFLCFGSMGSFGENQLKEIAYALEHSGHRFLWSVRRPPLPDKVASPTDYEDLKEVLPEGFLERTAAVGKVIGWAPQVAVLAHPAVGGFVSHCGWNSVLESLWFGVPIATWPMYAEQQFNAFEMVIELGLGVEIEMGYRKDGGMIVNSDNIERGIRCLMETDSERRKKVKEMSEKSRMALKNGGSSYLWLGRLIQDIMDNLA